MKKEKKAKKLVFIVRKRTDEEDLFLKSNIMGCEDRYLRPMNSEIKADILTFKIKEEDLNNKAAQYPFICMPVFLSIYPSSKYF